MANARILVFGEDDHDREVLRILIRALCPAASGRVSKRKKPLLLAKGAQTNALDSRAKKFAAVVRAERVIQPVACVFVHEDADDFAPADEARAIAMTAAAAKHGVDIFAVVPAWETEAWFFLFPDAVSKAFLIRTGFVGGSLPWKRMEHAEEQFAREAVPA
jgi:hypothetical protein